jgi:ABC-2 type transport system ATP-binding protein
VPVAHVQGLSKRYGAVQALRDVDVVVEQGCTGLVGSNGAGKSTLIKLLLGLIAPDGGQASVLGHDVATDPLAVRADVGYLPEGPCLPGDVTAADFVAFMAQLGGLPPRQARERASEICYQVGLEEERYRAIGGFSTGMQQRVKLAAALVHDPKLLLLDEPTDGMDPQGREDMLDLILRVRAELGVDVLVSTHLLGDVERVCDRVVMVHGGQVLLQGSIAEVAGTNAPGFGVQLGDGGPEVQAALVAAGLEVRPAGDELHVRLPERAPGTGVLGAWSPEAWSPGAWSPEAGQAQVPEAGEARSPRAGEAADLIRDVAVDHAWPLRRLAPRAPSLEETFLRVQRAASAPPAAPGPVPTPEPGADGGQPVRPWGPGAAAPSGREARR